MGISGAGVLIASKEVIILFSTESLTQKLLALTLAP
jgi:hypothetical protein